jgi:hypothetical protein
VRCILPQQSALVSACRRLDPKALRVVPKSAYPRLNTEARLVHAVAKNLVTERGACMHTPLNLNPNLDNYDDFYDMVTDSHQDLDEHQSKMLNDQLILLLSNHIGDLAVLRQAFALARVKVEPLP